jgi:lipopolysaccharide transport system ATP-binding protein
MKPILEINNISKKFLIDHERPSYLSMRDRIASTFKTQSKPEEFWALRDVSFDVMPGDSIGIIGRNGAGKSTLLKILSRITPPTEGNITIRGRIASLLEVGTGFHQELTGRENIFMNGSILGMKRAEIKNKFDEIVDFSGVERFLDTPLKNYSSGMQLRLAFAVAAHLEPEILIIDEVLAVGDAEFQKKCLGKMEEVIGQGRTILFVSHNRSAVQNLCAKAILLDQGKVHSQGPASLVLEEYAGIDQQPIQDHVNLLNIKRSVYIGSIRFAMMKFAKPLLRFGERIDFSLQLIAQGKEHLSDINIAIAINDKNGVCVIHASNDFIKMQLGFEGVEKSYTFSISNELRPGRYTITIFLRVKGVVQDWLTDVISFIIEDSNPYGYANTEAIQGLVFPQFSIIEK